MASSPRNNGAVSPISDATSEPPVSPRLLSPDWRPVPPSLPASEPLPLPDWVKDRKVRVYADGIYDCFHYGHARSLEQAKKLFGAENTTLLAGVCGDEITLKMKGMTVMSADERMECVRHCRWVDEVIPEAPWVPDEAWFEKNKIDIIVHGEDAAVYDGVDSYGFAKAKGMYRTIKRTEGISTSDLITRIVRNHKTYLKRNFSRGYTRQELNVGVLKELEIKLENSLGDLNQKIEGTISHWHEKTDQKMGEWKNDVSHIADDVKAGWKRTLGELKTKILGRKGQAAVGSSSTPNSKNNTTLETTHWGVSKTNKSAKKPRTAKITSAAAVRGSPRIKATASPKPQV